MAPSEATETKMFTRAEIAKHNNKEELWLVINDSVYDVTQYLEEHPGGEEIVINQAGQDATEAFEDAEHSIDAKQIMVKYKIGEIVQEERTAKNKKKNPIFNYYSKENGFSGSWKSLLIPIGLCITAIIVYRYAMRTR